MPNLERVETVGAERKKDPFSASEKIAELGLGQSVGLGLAVAQKQKN